MILYHGTNMNFGKIDLQKGRPNKDFGKGFYLTPIYEQAKDMAGRRVKIEEGVTTVKKYEFDEKVLTSSLLNVKIFEKPTKEWAEFILKNRYYNQQHSFDIVIGPIANDGVAFQLERYIQGIITIERLVEELTYRKLNIQYYFGTQKSLEFLKEI